MGTSSSDKKYSLTLKLRKKNLTHRNHSKPVSMFLCEIKSVKTNIRWIKYCLPFYGVTVNVTFLTTFCAFVISRFKATNVAV
jgi:hypothetical protein